MNDELMQLPKFKDCACGASLRVAPVRFDDELKDLKVGVTDCTYCKKAHFVFVGDTTLVDEFYQMLSEGMDVQEVKRRTYR